jgi:hypothetical protein
MPTARQFCSGLIALSTLAEATRMLAGTATGPSSSASPYVINVPTTVDISSLLTVGDSVSDKPGSTIPYRISPPWSRGRWGDCVRQRDLRIRLRDTVQSTSPVEGARRIEQGTGREPGPSGLTSSGFFTPWMYCQRVAS